MIKNFFLLSILGVLLGVHAQSIQAEIKKEAQSEVYHDDIQNVINQLEVDKTNSTSGFRVVIVYEMPQNCPIEVDSYTTETEYVTTTTTTDVYITRTPEVCANEHCEPQVEIITSTFVTVANAYVTAEANEYRAESGNGNYNNFGSGERNSDESRGDAGYRNSDNSRKLGNSGHDGNSGNSENSGSSGSSGSSGNRGSGNRHSGEDSGNQGFEYGGSHNGIAGAFALEIYASVGFASTVTVFKDAPTTTVEYISEPTPLTMTKPDPVFALQTMQGPDAIKINDWTFSAAATAEANFYYVAGTSGYSTADAKSLMSQETGSPYINSTTNGSEIEPGMGNKNSDDLESSLPVPEFIVFRSEATCVTHNDLFEKISTVDPKNFYTAKAHPLSILDGVSNTLPYQTNKFYSNLILENQDGAAFVWPYTVYWENKDFFGFGVHYPNPGRVVYGDGGVGGGKRFYYNSILSAALFLGAASITNGSNFMSVSDMKQLSANVKLAPEKGKTNDYVEFPLVEGMGLISAIYHGSLEAKIQGNGGISKFEKLEFEEKSDVTTIYRVDVGLGETWLVIVTLPNPDEDFSLEEKDNGKGQKDLVASKAVDGLIIQVALAPQSTKDEAVYYKIAGQYVTDADVLGSVACEQVNYRIAYATKGTSMLNTPLTYALPHHASLFSGEMESLKTSITLPSTTKGIMQAYLTKELVFAHEIDTNVQWLPYLESNRLSELTYTKDQIELIRQVAAEELEDVDIVETILKESGQYFRAKALDKYGYMLYVLHEIVKDEDLAQKILVPLKGYFKRYKEHDIGPILYYDTTNKGITTDGKDQFGSDYYNDHNFHYGYIVHSAAVIGYIDAQRGGNWAQENQDFINSLIRDVANPSLQDEFFPVFRSFDWFQGHSWAHGLTAVGDGEDLESTSEDVHFSYAMKLWGKVIGDKAMEARGDLMVRVQRESFGLYFNFKDGNQVVRPEIVKNKVSGILFENKIDYATWFGGEVEKIHGIQMIPMTPGLGSARSSVFAKQEWDQILGSLDQVLDGWIGILNANRVFFDPVASWDYFAEPKFSYKSGLDGGQSRSWALAYAAPFRNHEMGISANGGSVIQKGEESKSEASKEDSAAVDKKKAGNGKDEVLDKENLNDSSGSIEETIKKTEGKTLGDKDPLATEEVKNSVEENAPDVGKEVVSVEKNAAKNSDGLGVAGEPTTSGKQDDLAERPIPEKTGDLSKNVVPPKNDELVKEVTSKKVEDEASGISLPKKGDSSLVTDGQ